MAEVTDPATKVALVGFDPEIRDLIKLCGLDYLGYVDTRDLGHPDYLGDDRQAEQLDCHIAFGMLSSSTRRMLWPRYGRRAITLVSPLGHVSDGARIGSGTTVQHRTTVMPEVVIGSGCQLHVAAIIHHEAVLADFVTIAPSAVLLGRCRIGEAAFIGAGAVIRSGINVGREAVVGMGSVVVRDVPAGQTVVGVPARPMRR